MRVQCNQVSLSAAHWSLLRAWRYLLECAAAVGTCHQGFLVVLLVSLLVELLNISSTGWQGHVSDL